MNLLFRVPEHRTKVIFLTEGKRLKAKFLEERVRLLVDNGAPLSFALPRDKVYSLAGGEGSKRWAALQAVLSWLAIGNTERSASLVVVGGGAILDLGGLAASLYRRGLPLVLVPTTLLGMVDATLGGKTAVDFESNIGLIKNFAGTFYPADEVWILPEFLNSLSTRERVSGAGEVFKTLWISGGKWSEQALIDFVRGEKVSRELKKIIKQCLEVKRKIVAKDPLDKKRIREVLNFGHTVGHVLEARSDLSHGECVLWGMAIESQLLGKNGMAMAARCQAALSALGLNWDPEWAEVSEEEWLRLLATDKKTKSGKMELSLLAKPGKIVRKKVALTAIAAAITSFQGFDQRA